MKTILGAGVLLESPPGWLAGSIIHAPQARGTVSAVGAVTACGSRELKVEAEDTHGSGSHADRKAGIVLHGTIQLSIVTVSRHWSTSGKT